MIDERVKLLREKAKLKGEPILRDKSLEVLLETAKKIDAKNILEIGTNVGLTSASLLLELKNAKLTTLEIDEEKAQIAKQTFKDLGVFDRAKVHIGDASEIIPILSGKYDFIFLDGPKGHYFYYLQFLLPLLNVGGILFADDILFHGYIKGKTPKKHNTIKHSIDSFLQEILTNKNLKTQIYEIEDGISITEKIK